MEASPAQHKRTLLSCNALPGKVESRGRLCVTVHSRGGSPGLFGTWFLDMLSPHTGEYRHTIMAHHHW